MFLSRSTAWALTLATALGALSASAAEPVPTSVNVIRSLPKLQPRFQEPPREDLIIGTRLTNPAAPAVKVDRFEFIGATLIPVAELQERVAKFAGRSLSSTDIDEAAEEVAKLYRSRGYPLAAAALAGPVAGGVARLQVYEGRIAAIKIEGNQRYTDEAFLYAFKDLPRGKPLTVADVESGALLLSEEPGLDVQVQALPSTTPGESNLMVRATEDSFQISTTIDNDGVEAAGRKRMWVGIDVNGASGWGDQLSLLLMNSERFAMDYARLQYSLQMTQSHRVGVSYALGKWDGIGPGVAPLGVRGKSSEMQVWMSLPTVRTRALTREWRVMFEKLEGTTLLGPSEFESGQVRSVGVGLHDSSWGTDGTGWTRNFEFDTNFASRSAAEPYGHLGQLRFNGSSLVARGDWQILTKGRVVYSQQEVEPLKQFRIGGPDSVRAYDYGQQAGDGGFEGTIEFLGPLGGAGPYQPRFAMFVDVGYTSYKDVAVVPATNSGPLGGAGLGLRFKGSNWHLDLDYAHPVGQHATVDDDTNGYLWGRIGVNF